MADFAIPLQTLEAYNAQISTVVGAFASFCGFFALFAADAMCKIAGLLQIVTGALVIAIEGPNFLPQLGFAAPLATVFEGKPAWVKVAVYTILTIVPTFAGCFKAFILGFIASALITVLHALLLLGQRPPRDEFDIQPVPQGGAPNSQVDGAFSPTSP